MKKLKLNIQMFASTNKTANYDLPQFVGTDKPTWLGDINEAMADIDAGMHENATNISNMASDVASASATASQASQDVAGLTSTVNSLSSDVTGVTTTANNAQSTATSALNTANTANGKADTNASNIGTLSNLNTTDKTNIVSAINEVNTKVLNEIGGLLWDNPNPTDNFGETTITLDSDDYDYLIWNFRVDNNLLTSLITIKGWGGRIFTHNLDGALRYRTITRNSDTSYTITTAHDTNSGNYAGALIPEDVIGCKF